MKLSKRLQAIANMVDENAIVADIGCDHAQLCISLVVDNKIQKAYACDVNEGPLSQAQKNIEYYKLQDQITTILSDGLAALEDDVTTIVIAGMGYETIEHILTSHPNQLQKGRTFIVQANKEVEKLRNWISNHHYRILSEKTINEDHYYQIIKFQIEEDTSLNETEIQFGRHMIKDFEFYSMWKYRLSKWETILRQLDKSHPKYDEITYEMKKIYEEFARGSN